MFGSIAIGGVWLGVGLKVGVFEGVTLGVTLGVGVIEGVTLGVGGLIHSSSNSEI